MADSQIKPTQPIPWSLAVVRGRDVGRVYALGAGETIVGNALNSATGLDLMDQEGGSPRRMAARHAAITLTGQELAIRDLDTPGGTFVNRQRLLSGQSRRLQPGDVIQLGSVQLRVEARATSSPAATAAPPPLPTTAAPPPLPAAVRRGSPDPVPGRLPIPFAMAGGPSCRTWDDFLVLAAQHWKDLRDELASGRLAEYLRHIQRLDLMPRLEKDRSLDEQLDEWLARLPVTRSSAPELDVHPEALNVRAAAGGGITRQALRVSNVGYRLLRCTARVEPAGTRWIRLRPEHDGRPFFTIEQTDLPIELEIPEVLDRPLTAAIVLESNGGTRRVGVRIERPVTSVAVIEPAAGPGGAEVSDWARRLGGRIARLEPGVRMVLGVFGMIALRVFVMLSALMPVGGRTNPLIEPRLSALAVVLAGVGIVAGGWLGRRRGERLDLVSAGFAGGLFGLLSAAVIYAVIQSVETLLGSWSSSLWAVGLVWAAIGAVIAGVSILLIPYRTEPAEAAP